MMTRTEMKQIARERLRDARLLLRQSRYDGAIYLGGYVVEMALKERICRTLKWSDFPNTGKEFSSLQSFKTHNLEDLLHLSGIEARIKGHYLNEWSDVVFWNPELRYNSPGNVSRADAQAFVNAAAVLLRVLSP